MVEKSQKNQKIPQKSWAAVSNCKKEKNKSRLIWKIFGIVTGLDQNKITLGHRLSTAAADCGRRWGQIEAPEANRQEKTGCSSDCADPIVTNHEEMLLYGKSAQKTLIDSKPCDS